MLSGVWTLTLFSLLNGAVLLVAYIANNSFPQPLKESEEKMYLELMSKGDKKARNILVEHNLRLVAHIVKKFDNCGVDNDDLISIGTIGLIKAINSFNQDKNVRLATYSARCIENEILMHLRSIKKTKSNISLFEPIGFDKEGNEVNLQNLLGTDPDSVFDNLESTMETEQLYRIMSCLSKREKSILCWRFGLGNCQKLTQKQIATHFGISRSYVSRIEKKAIGKLIDKFNK